MSDNAESPTETQKEESQPPSDDSTTNEEKKKSKQAHISICRKYESISKYIYVYESFSEMEIYSRCVTFI